MMKPLALRSNAELFGILIKSTLAILCLCVAGAMNRFPGRGQDTDNSLDVAIDESVEEVEPIEIPAGAVELPQEFYNQVATRSIGISEAEAPAYYAILHHAQVIPSDRLRQAAFRYRQVRHEQSPLFRDKPISEFQPFVDLFKNPDKYIGQPVTMTGYTRRLVSVPADPNPYGIETLYELWLFTDDSQNNPLVVVCSEVPEDLPRGDDLINGITVTGYFFKLYGYDAEDNKRLAPMLLAHRVTWNPPKPAEPLPISPWVLYPVLLGIIGIVIFLLWYTAYRDRVNSPLRHGKLPAGGKLTFGEQSTVGDEQFPMQMPPVHPDPRSDSESDQTK